MLFIHKKKKDDYFLREVNELKTLPLYVTDDGDIGGEGYDWEFRRIKEPEELSLKWGSDESSILALLKIRIDSWIDSENS